MNYFSLSLSLPLCLQSVCLMYQWGFIQVFLPSPFNFLAPRPLSLAQKRLRKTCLHSHIWSAKHTIFFFLDT